ncbi:MAG: FemAB family XrtA/PEP-CTERM system-associated protein [Kiloniellaceae bacterium]
MNDHSGPVLEVRGLDDAWREPWDSFVRARPEATFLHLSGWKQVIEESFGHRCYFLLAESRGEIRGVLPLVHVASRLFGNALISNAFCVYGGPVTADPKARAALDRSALDLAERLKVDHLEYRLRAPSHGDWFQNSGLYVTFRKRIDPDPEINLAAVPRKQRAMVRKGIKAGLQSEWDTGVDRFYRIYAESVRNLGTPVFSKKYFRKLKEIFGEACEILTVTHEGRPVSGVVSFLFRDEVLPYYGGGTAEARCVAANDFMYWEVMRRACQRGYRVFDFGRSKKGTGSYAFKKHWGFEPEPLYYEYKLIGRDAPPEVNPTNPKYRLCISLWKRLPLRIANLVGPYISRDLG